MSHDSVLKHLLDQVAEGKISRRSAIRRAATLGAGAAALGLAGKDALAQDASPAASPVDVESSYEPQGPQVDELVLWTRSSVDTSPNEWNALKAATERYTELVGTPVKMVTVPDGDFRPKLSQAAPGGDGPDIFGPVAHDWIGEVALQGIAAPWEDSEIVGFEDIPQSVVDAVTYDGQVYGYPVFSETLAFYINKDMVDAAPETWGELVSTANDLTSDDTYGFVFQLLTQYYQGAFFHAMGSYIFGSTDGTLNTDDIGLNNEGGVEAAKFLRDMYWNQQPQLPEAVLDQAGAGDFINGLQESGQAAMFIDGPWREPALTDASINYEVTTFPSLDNGETLKPFSGIQVFEANAYGKNLEASKDLINFLGSTEGVQLMVPGFNKPPVRETLRDFAVDLNPNLATYMDIVADAIPMPNIPQMAQVWEPWGDAMIGIISSNVSDDEVQALLDAAVEQIKANIQ